MRYLNWDVLLFPGSSRVPLQEFDTKCHVLPDSSNRFIENTTLNKNPYLSEAESLSQIPALTTFISSLEHGSSFRVSIHSWETPKPSQVLRTFKTFDESVAFEARVYIDGDMVAQRIFDGQAVWPAVIDSVGNADTIHPKPLRFPSFHSEILDQTHWEPGETYGRVKIVIAEGVVEHCTRNRTKTTFDRLRDIINFSFQHAPRQVLEHSGIAWPSAQLFRNGARLIQNNIANRAAIVPDFEAHAHSPQRQQGGKRSHKSADILINTTMPKETSGFDDPFVGPMPISLRGRPLQNRSLSTDISMKDYSSIRTTRSYAATDMSGVSYQKPDFERAMNEAAIPEIVRALSPQRKQDLLTALSPVKQEIEREALHSAKISPSLVSAALIAIIDRGRSKNRSLSEMPKSDTGDHAEASWAQGNLLSSRFASVPVMSHNTQAIVAPNVQRGLRSSIDPPLSTDWVQQVLDSDVSSLQGKPTPDHRPRSSSNVSKRKRQDSPCTNSPVALSKDPSMSTSPCKPGATSTLQDNNENGSGGGVTLNKRVSS